MTPWKPRHVVFCLCSRFPMFCLVSVLEVLRHANRMAGQPVYHWSFLTEEDKVIVDANGLWLYPSLPLKQAGDASLVFVVAGFAAWDIEAPALLGWLQRQARHGAMLGGISNGSFVLARAGLLDGFAATTHWEDFSSFCERFPAVRARYQRFVLDRRRMSCSGGASTLDLALEVVRHDLGPEIARQVSRQMLLEDVVPPKAPVENPRVLDGSRHYSHRVQRILTLLDAGLDGEMTVQRLAEQVGLGRRELLRLLRRETGQTPSQLLNERRLERARSLVRHSHLALAAVADAVGFSSQSHLTLRYRQAYAVTPAEDRRRHRHQAGSGQQERSLHEGL
ncbi:MAG: helix-turn-helix domain-containing protein [Thiolinea sp.]